MRNNNRIFIDRDRAFDINAINELLTQGKAILTEAISISQKMEISIAAIASIYNGIDAEYKVGALGSDIDALSGKLRNDIYQDTITRMDTILNKLMNDIPSYDTALAQSMDAIEETLHSVKGRIGELRSLLDTGDIDLSYPQFSQRLQELKAGWDMTTEDLSELLTGIENDMLGLSAAAAQYSKDPVNLSTGNFVYDHEDIKINGEIPLSFHRYYNAKSRGKGTLGRCFVHNYEIRLEEDPEKGKATVTMGDGQKKTFRRNPDGTYQSLHSALETLTKQGDNYALKTLTGEKTLFDQSGHMIRQENRNARGITFTHDENGRLQKAQTDNHTSLTYAYDQTGQLTSVTDHTGRCVELTYEKGKLATVQTPQGATYAYRYAKNGRIEQTINPRGQTSVQNTYDEKRRVTRQQFPDGGHMDYAYDDARRQVTLTERNGSKITYLHDSRYRTTDILYQDGTKEHFAYNEKNQKTLHTDRNGNTTRMSYDNRGNLTQLINPLGEKTSLTYNADNQLTTLKINGKEKLRNTYDKKGNLLTATAADGTGTHITYDGQGRPIRIQNPDNTATDITYDHRGNITHIQDAGGADITYQYDDLNRAIRTLDANGNATAYEYDHADKITRVTNPLGAHRDYTYNESGKVTRVTDYDGHTIQAAYNPIGRISAITDKEGNTTQYTYDNMWNTSRVLQPDGGTIDYTYDTDNRLSEKHLPDGATIHYTYDPNGNPTAITDPEGNRTTYTYDALNRLIQETDPTGAQTRYAYDQEGNLTSVTDALGNQTTYTYDALNRCVSQTDPMGNTTAYAYDPMGNIVDIRYPNGSEEKRAYKNGKLQQLTKPDGATIRYTYDPNGNCTSMENATGEKLTATYDALNRRTTVTNPDGGTLRYEYDPLGNLTAMTDPNGRRTDYTYTPNGNLAAVTDALGNQTRYTYDPMGRLTKVERIGEVQETAETQTQTTTYQRNTQGLVTAITDPLGATETFSYDKNGRLTDKYDKDGFHTAYTHDSRGLLTNILYADGNDVAYTYDPLRRLKETRENNNITHILTDALGRVTSVTDPAGNTVAYEWGNMNEKLRLTYPDGQETTYTYNEKGQLTTLTAPGGAITYAYDPLGRLMEKTFPNGITTQYTYNKAGMFETIRHTGNGFQEQYTYKYDLSGNKTETHRQRHDTDQDNGTFTYTYDPLNRLTRVTRTGQPLRKYTYDALGNRTAKEDYTGQTPTLTTYRYNANNQMTALIDAGQEQTYTYDRRGNLTTVTAGEQLLKTFTFDAANHMTAALQIKDGVEKTAHYTYDALGNRTGQDTYTRETGNPAPAIDHKAPQDPEQHIRYTLDLTRQYHNLLLTQDAATGKKQTFHWDANVAAMQETGQNSYYLQDDLGSPMLLTDEQGQIRESYAFDEYGQALRHTPEDQLQPFGYTGYQMETTSGLYFAQARRYDAAAGRFTSEDKIPGLTTLPHTMNRYTYCWNQPLEHVDLNGRFPWLIIPLILGVTMLTGCSTKETEVVSEPYTPVIGTDLEPYTPVYDCERYNTEEYQFNTNCYAYAFGMLENPITGEKFPLYGNQPGLLSNDTYYRNSAIPIIGSIGYFNHYLAGTSESNQNLINVVKADMDVVGINFIEYQEGMEGGKRVALVVQPGGDYHWYVYDELTGTWYNKHGTFEATNKAIVDQDANGYPIYGDIMTDYAVEMEKFNYILLGEFYITRKDGECFE